ncbi:MAG: hypothetical protein IVW57_09915 [Ktedonobacterales bacterium]|nr:hypothetical protein [Ktedonobacterales bacterium]
MRRLGDDAGRAAGDLASVGKGEGDTAGPGCGNLSFAPETLVTLADGSRQPIARVRVGDQVRAFDPTTGQASAQTVQATWIQHDTNLFAVTLRMTRDTDTDTAVSGVRKARRVAVVSHGSQAPPLSSAGATTSSASTTTRSAPTITGDETIATTANHPWLTTDRGWAQAGSLTLGERVRRVDGGTALVVALRAVVGTAPRYDLTVSRLHDFAVGTGAYVVHNCGGENKSFIGQRMRRRVDDDLLSPPQERGAAPTEKTTGQSIEIHHINQAPEGPFEEMTPFEHRGRGNFRANHPFLGTGYSSRIDRDLFAAQKWDYWAGEWDRGRWGAK